MTNNNPQPSAPRLTEGEINLLTMKCTADVLKLIQDYHDARTVIQKLAAGYKRLQYALDHELSTYHEHKLHPLVEETARTLLEDVKGWVE